MYKGYDGLFFQVGPSHILSNSVGVDLQQDIFHPGFSLVRETSLGLSSENLLTPWQVSLSAA